MEGHWRLTGVIDGIKFGKSADFTPQDGNSSAVQIPIEAPFREFTVRIEVNPDRADSADFPRYAYKYEAETRAWYFFRLLKENRLKLLRNPERLPAARVWLFLRCNHEVPPDLIEVTYAQPLWVNYNLVRLDLRGGNDFRIHAPDGTPAATIRVGKRFELHHEATSGIHLPPYSQLVTADWVEIREVVETPECNEYKVHLQAIGGQQEVAFSTRWLSDTPCRLALGDAGIEPGRDYQVTIMERDNPRSLWARKLKWLPNFTIDAPTAPIVPSYDGHAPITIVTTVAAPVEVLAVDPTEVRVTAIRLGGHAEETRTTPTPPATSVLRTSPTGINSYALEVPGSVTKFKIELGVRGDDSERLRVPITLQKVQWTQDLTAGRWTDRPITLPADEFEPGENEKLYIKNVDVPSVDVELFAGKRREQKIRGTPRNGELELDLLPFFDDVFLGEVDLHLRLAFQTPEANAAGTVQRFVPLVFVKDTPTWASLTVLGLDPRLKVEQFPLEKMYDLLCTIKTHCPTHAFACEELLGSLREFTKPRESSSRSASAVARSFFHDFLRFMQNFFTENRWFENEYPGWTRWAEICEFYYPETRPEEKQ